MSILFWHRRNAPDFASLTLALFGSWKDGTAGYMNVIYAVIDPSLRNAIERKVEDDTLLDQLINYSNGQ